MMSDSSPLHREYEQLRDSTNPQRRGYDLQGLVGRILGSYHFTVATKAGAASPRQVDLFATLGDTIYLIETKWRQDRANVNDVDSLYKRLEKVAPNVTGLLVSYAGFTQQVLDTVRENSSRPVILVSGKELEQALQWDGDFLGLLRRKASALLVHRNVLVDVELRRSRRRLASKTKPSDLPSSDRLFVLPDGTRHKWLQCDGSFDRFTFVPELQDIDWVSGNGLGVTLDIVLPAQQGGEFDALLHQMARMGWVTPKGCWSIQQSTAMWHGFGADALLVALRDWKRRYEGLDTHHTEELCYVDECEDGFYTLVAQFSADGRSIVWRVELSFQLRGIPLDTGPYRELCAHFELSDPVYFRPRSERSHTWGHPPRTSKLKVVKPLAYVVVPEKLVPGDDDEEWVAGIVVDNPFFDGRSRSRRPPEWVPDMVARSGYLVCALRSWHVLGNTKSVYELRNFESAWTSDALVVRATADWQDEPDPEVPSLTVTIPPEPAPRRRSRQSSARPEPS